MNPNPKSKSEYMATYNKDYYVKNKAKLLADAVAKVRCEHCNVDCSKSNMSKHCKTQKHILHMQLNQQAQPAQ